MHHCAIPLIIFVSMLLLIYYIANKPLQVESFAVQFGTPPETTDTDHSHIQNLLEIGSQSHENTKYDVVSTHLLGDIARPAPPPPPPPPPDPVCFQDDDDEPDERVDFDKQENCCADAINKPRDDK